MSKKKIKQGKPPPPSATQADLKKMIRIGGPIDRITVGLRIFGEKLDPKEITRLLGARPSLARRKGDVIPNPRYHLVAKTGCWLLSMKVPDGRSVELQVRELLRRVTKDLAAWESLTERYRADVFCGLFLDEWNRGFELSADVMRQLGERGLKIGFDIYGPTPTLGH